MNREPPSRDIRNELTDMLVDNRIESPADRETAADLLAILSWGQTECAWAEALIAREGKEQP